MTTPRLPIRSGLTDEDKARRRATLGSSEIAAVAGVSPYQSAHGVWLSKCRGVDFEGNEATTLGTLLEPAILGIYSDRYGRTLRRGTYTIGPEPWMSCTPDAVDVTDGDNDASPLVEAKLVGLRSIWMWGPGNTDEATSDAVPMHYLAQALWQRICRGAPYVDVAALLGTEFRTYRIHPNERAEAMLVERGREFWERYVMTGEPPPIDGSEGAAELLKRLYPRDGAEPIEADGELEELAAKLTEARTAFERAQQDKRLHENLIKARLKDARGARGNGWRIRYSATKKGTRPFVFETDDDRAA